MVIKKIIATTKETLNKDIAEQEKQKNQSSKTALSDEELDLVSGGSNGGGCPRHGVSNLVYSLRFNLVYCGYCNDIVTKDSLSKTLNTDRCPQCNQRGLDYKFNISHLECQLCGYTTRQEFGELFTDW